MSISQEYGRATIEWPLLDWLKKECRVMEGVPVAHAFGRARRGARWVATKKRGDF